MAARVSNLKRKRSRKGRGGFAAQSNRIIYNDIGTAIAITVILERFRSANMEIRLYVPVTQSTSTTRLLLLALQASPDEKNAIAIKHLIQYFRERSPWFREFIANMKKAPQHQRTTFTSCTTSQTIARIAG